jgi:hypothetical protein
MVYSVLLVYGEFVHVAVERQKFCMDQCSITHSVNPTKTVQMYLQ